VPLPEVPKFKEDKGPPHFTFHLRPRLIQKNHPCKLICTVAGNPTPKIEWLKDGLPVNQDRVQLLFKSGVCTLEIFNTRADDAGSYTCRASNELGEAVSDCLLTVQKRGEPTPSAAMLSSRPRRIYDSLRSDFDLERSRSTAEVRPRASEKYAAMFATKDDSEVSENKTEKALPTFSSTLSDVHVDSGESAEFSCTVEGSPEPLVEWLHNGEKISASSSKHSQSFANGRATLRVSEVGSDDEGEYCCRASNSTGTETSKARLAVRPKENGTSNGPTAPSNDEPLEPSAQLVSPGTSEPRVARLPQSIEAAVGSAAKMVLELENAEGYTVQWFKGNEKVEKSDRVKSVKSGNSFKLDFKSIEPEDESTYTVKVVKDKKAIAKYSATLHIAS
jgi:titin